MNPNRTPAWLVLLGTAALAQNPEPPTGRLEGRVVDALGQPVAMADVWVSESNLPFAGARTDGSGSFLMPALPLRDYVLHARADGHTVGSRVVRLLPETPWLRTELRLFDADVVTGTVTAGGKPVAGAAVVLDQEVVRTDERGGYRFDRVPLGERQLLVWAGGHRLHQEPCQVRGPTVADIVLTADSRQSLRLQLHDVPPEVLRGNQCRVTFNRDGKALTLPDALCVGVADVRGDCVFDNVPGDVGFADFAIRLSAGSTLQGRATNGPGGCFLVPFHWREGPPLRWTARCRQLNGRPIGELALRARVGAGPAHAVTTTALGAFDLPADSMSGQSLRLITVDPTMALDTRTQHHTRIIPWVSGGVLANGAELDVRVRPAVAVTGELRGPDGQPLPGASVQLWHPTIDVDTGLVAATDRAGRFRIDRVLPGVERLVLRVDCLEGGTVSEPFDAPETGILDLGRIQLRATARVSGKVIAADGSSLAGALVTLLPKGRQRLVLGPSYSDRHGRFVVRGVPAGEYRLTLLVGDAMMTPARQEPIVVVGDETIQRDVDLR